MIRSESVCRGLLTEIAQKCFSGQDWCWSWVHGGGGARVPSRMHRWVGCGGGDRRSLRRKAG